MSWTFQLHKINQSFDRIAVWYTEFMRRTELCFRSFHERILRLEERQVTSGPGDEQVERVLRKILAERFGHSALPHNSNIRTQTQDYFVEPHGKHTIPQAFQIDPVSLMVDPDSVPSMAYVETFQMLEERLAHFPHIKSSRPEDEDDEDAPRALHVKTPTSMGGA